MPVTELYRCKQCGDHFRARVADRKRGWARYCSKSCKAIKQTQRTGRGSGGRIMLPNGGWIAGGQQFDRNGISEGFLMGPADLAAGGYGDSGRDDPFHSGKL